MNPIHYYDIEAEQVDIFGNLREIPFGENILRTLPKTTKTFIDIACGDGYLLHCVTKSKKHKISAYGVDLSYKRLQKTSAHVQNVSLFQGTVLKLPFKDNSFDAVVCSETLEHLPDYITALRELLRITKKTLVITVPNEENIMTQHCPKCDHQFYINDHVNSFTAESFTRTIKQQSEIPLKITIKKFQTIYSYNRATLKWPSWVRMSFDRLLAFCSKKITFLKPNYSLICIKKRRDNVAQITN